MSTHLRSDNISLLFGDDGFGEYTTINELWQTLRRTAVEPGQASSPDFASFADECLLCAQIVTNEPSPTEGENGHHGSYWDPEERALDPTRPPSMASILSPSPIGRRVGLIYLHAGPANLAGGEANIGVVTMPTMQCHGYAREAVQLVLRWAFEELKFHRVQAAILDSPFKDRALRLFIGSGFSHEGTKRRAVYQPEGEGMASVWKDVTYLAMLDTDWMVKSMWRQINRAPELPVVSVWDEMFARHAREREELVRWEENHGRIRRPSSMETLREHARNVAQNIAYLTDDASSFSGSLPPSPRPNVVSREEDPHMVDAPATDVPRQSWEDVVETLRRHRQLDPSLQSHMLFLPSIPSSGLSEGNLQSPLTISSPSTPGSMPSSSPSPSPSPSAPSPAHSTWTDTEDEDNWLPREDLAPTHVPMQFTMPQDLYPRTSSRTRSRSSSVSSSSSNSWSDAQSSIGASSSSWDLLSDRSHPLSS